MNKHIITSTELINNLVDFIEQDEFRDNSIEVIYGYVPAPKLNFNSQPNIVTYLVNFESNYYLVEYIHSDFFIDEEDNFVNYDVELSHEVWMISEYDAKCILDEHRDEDGNLMTSEYY